MAGTLSRVISDTNSGIITNSPATGSIFSHAALNATVIKKRAGGPSDSLFKKAGAVGVP